MQAVLGKKGIYEGKDYRGVPVLSDLCAIPSSPWFIVAKVDSEEIFAEARFRTISICLIVGAFIMMFGVFIAYLYRQWKADIAERNREAEREKLAAVHETQALLQAALNISQVGIAIADAPSGTLRYVNDAGLVILGVDSQSVVAGVGIDQYVSSWQMLALDRRPMDPDEIPLTRAIRYGETCSREFIIQRAVGDERIIQANAAPIRDALGKVSAAIVVFIDITESKQMEEDLRKKNAEIERFTYTVSHDLKSPLVTIKTFLVYLEKDLKAQKVERAAKDLSFIHGAVDKMALLLDELLELARVGYHTTLPEEMRLQDVVQDAQSLVSGQIDARGVEVVVTQEPVWLYGDRPRLMEVFQNLLDNAVKFLGDQPAPHVEIGAEQVGDELELFVRDNGKGIDQRYHTKVFGLFEKLDASAKGSGLGLALVKRIVELHGGKIWVQSEGPGQGTTFRFTLAKTRLRQRAPALT